VLADRHARARGIQQTDGLVGQLPIGDEALGELDGGLQGLVQQLHAMVLLQCRGRTAQHQQRFVDLRLLYLHHLEAPSQRRVTLEVFLVFVPGGRGDGSQLTSGQRRLEQIGGIPRALRAASADQRVRLIDE
jgi:hypothetical protein